MKDRPIPEPPRDRKYVLTQKALGRTLHERQEAERKEREAAAQRENERRLKASPAQKFLGRVRRIREEIASLL